MIKVHKSLRKVLSILTFVGMFMSSTGMAFVPVAQAQSFNPEKPFLDIIDKLGGISICIDGDDNIRVSTEDDEKIVELSQIINDLQEKLPFPIPGLSKVVEGLAQKHLDSCEDSGVVDEEDDLPVVVNNTGTIEVCKVVVNENGAIIEGNDATFTFSYDVFERIATNKKEDVGTTPNIGDSQTLDIGTSNCTSVTVEMGEEEVVDVVYGEIELSSDYELVGYHDRYTGPVTTEVIAAVLDNPAPTTVDNHDGHVVLNKNGNRSILVVNRLLDEPQVPVDPNLTATVEMCKLDDSSNNPLPGWELSLTSATPVDIVAVAPNGTTVTSDVLEAGDYLLKVSGTYTYRPKNMQADAAFSHRKSSDNLPGQGDDGLWHLSSSSTNKYLGLQVNSDGATGWGNTFNSSHEYSQTVTLASKGEISFLITDNNYGDNSGVLEVEIYRVYGGETGQNGCVTLKDVPFGQYDVDEVMQEGWQNVSGLGRVTVNGESVTEGVATFYVFNKSTTIPEEPIGRCELGDTDMWAMFVKSFDQGATKNDGDFQGGRSDATKALGSNTSDFVSLGFGGEIVLEFNKPFVDAPGADIRIHEITNGFTFDQYPETAEVSVSENGTDWTVLGEARGANVNEFDLADASYTDAVRYIKIVDTSNMNHSGFPNNHTADGFDLAAVEVLGCEPGEEPEPEDNFSISGTKTEVINGDEAMGEGWEIELYRLVDTVEVDSEESTAVSSSVSLTDGTQYLLEVSGTYKFGNPNRRADAEYISELGDWTDVANDTYEDDFLDLLVDGVARDWGEFDSSHTYYLPFAGTGSAVSFLIKDRAFAYGDNEGFLTVRIFELAGTDITNNDGGYSFDNLEEGTYLVREVNQEGWTQILPETAHCEITLSANNSGDECDFINEQDETSGNGSGDGDDEPAPTFRSSSRSGGRILGDRTHDLNSDGEIGEVLGAATSIYPGMPNAGHTSAFSGSLVLAVQALVIGAALFFHNRKMFGTRVG